MHPELYFKTKCKQNLVIIIDLIKFIVYLSSYLDFFYMYRCHECIIICLKNYKNSKNYLFNHNLFKNKKSYIIVFVVLIILLMGNKHYLSLDTFF